ncbi:general stress protein [Planomonospora corallina]|uniref:General stress protein n=1 Tax=Planomonospora corallina TaxID=1806052 RepID=A0ABV8IA47_9ACTN
MTQLHTGVGTPVVVDRRTLVGYDNYAAAQRTVDALSDAGFPVEHVAIVGTDLRMEETVTGRMTNGRAALLGAGNGLFFGLLVGAFLGLFTSTTLSFLMMVLWAGLWGAVMGAAFGFLNHYYTRGKRDFSSRSAIVAGRYDVLVAASHADHARAVLDGVARPADTVVVDPPVAGGYDPGVQRPIAPEQRRPGR